MLDIKILRDDPDRVRAGLTARGSELDVQPLLDLDTKRRAIITEAETLKQSRNAASKEIGKLKQQGEDAEGKMAEVRMIGDTIAALDEKLLEIEEALDLGLRSIPNLPHADVPVGTDETANRVIRTEGEPVVLDFEGKAHWDIGEELGLFDFQRGARMSGSGFPVLKGAGARLSRALKQFMLDLHTTEHGYMEVEAPLLVNDDAMIGTGQLPKMEEDMYRVPGDGLWLIPTAEVPLTNLPREEILDQPLPVNLTGYTPCFRREAGAAGKMTRGLNRVHQFDKIELVKLADPASSYEQLDILTSHAETVLQRLGLHYRVLELCTGDLSFASARTYDLELWVPGQEAWLEVSSCSNFEDFQARRAKIRYRGADGKPAFVHTLNGSGVALPRLIVAILECGQQADGSVLLPEALWPYMNGVQRLVRPGG